MAVVEVFKSRDALVEVACMDIASFTLYCKVNNSRLLYEPD